MGSLSAWLSALDLNRYAQVFADNDIDLEVLPALSEQDLESLGVSLGHRKKLLKAIAGLKTDSSAQHAAGEPSLAAPINLTDGERRQLTVMFCDLVGSTALAERLDPEELRAIIRAYQGTAAQIIESFGGHIAQYLGDGLLVYFGHPRAHEDDAARAVHAGLGIVAALRELNARQVGDAPTQLSVRIGIHTGLVVVGEIGGGGSREQLALGDTPNLAARLQGFAAPDTVVLSEQTRRLAGGSFEYADLGEQSLKGIAEPVRIWHITGASAVASRFEAATQGVVTPLVGREHEVAMLLERWQLAQDGEGQVVLLSGEAGIGKSRILRALRERLQAAVRSTLLLQCSPHYINSAFYPTIDNFERALKFSRDETAESKLDKLETLLVGSYRRPRDDVRFIATILSLPCEARYGPLEMTPQRQKDETIRALVDIVEAAARLQPMVMLFEDAHWADPTSLDVLDLLIDRIGHLPLLMVLTHRPEFQSRWSQHGHVTALNLSKLTRAQSSAMVSRLTHDQALPGELLEQILVKTDGVPLYVEELTKSILESGELKIEGDRYAYVGGAHTFTIPATLRDSLVARLDRVPAVKEIAQIGAVIGREFSYELIAALAPHAGELDHALGQLTDSGLAFRRGTPPDALYTFKHALVQDAAYDSLLKSHRRSLHATIAHVIDEKFPATKDTEPELLAHHLTEAGEIESAIGYWRKAGELGIKRLAIVEAISHLNQGMTLNATLTPSPQREGRELDLRILLGMAWIAIRGWQENEVWNAIRPALTIAKSLKRDDAFVPIFRALAAHVLVQGRVAESLTWVTEAYATALENNDPDLLMISHQQSVVAYSWHGDWAKAREHGDQVMALYQPAAHRHIAMATDTDPKTIAGNYAAVRNWILGYPDQAVVVCDAIDAHARERGHPFDIAFGLTISGQVFHFLGEPERLLARADEIERLGRMHSLPFFTYAMGPIQKGVALLLAGRITDGIPRLRSAIEIWHAFGGGVWMPHLKAILAEGYAHSGDLTSALSLIEESSTQIARPGWEERCHLAEVLRLKGWMLSLQGDTAGAEHNYLASLDVAREQQAKSWELRTATSLARLWQGQGKMREARKLLAPIYSWFSEGFGTKDLQEAKALLEELG